MNRRRDAMLGAAEMITSLNGIARSIDDFARLTIGRLDVEPNSGATIPGKATFVVDFRHPDLATLESYERRLRESMTAIAAGHRLDLGIEQTINKPPVDFAGDLVETIRAA
jgi:N-carbamoyl-L-amino-acid hydrolase